MQSTGCTYDLPHVVVCVGLAAMQVHDIDVAEEGDRSQDADVHHERDDDRDAERALWDNAGQVLCKVDDGQQIGDFCERSERSEKERALRVRGKMWHYCFDTQFWQRIHSFGRLEMLVFGK